VKSEIVRKFESVSHLWTPKDTEITTDSSEEFPD
jgi:hypothetical protein